MYYIAKSNISYNLLYVYSKTFMLFKSYIDTVSTASNRVMPAHLLVIGEDVSLSVENPFDRRSHLLWEGRKSILKSVW